MPNLQPGPNLENPKSKILDFRGWDQDGIPPPSTNLLSGPARVLQALIRKVAGSIPPPRGGRKSMKSME